MQVLRDGLLTWEAILQASHQLHDGDQWAHAPCVEKIATVVFAVTARMWASCFQMHLQYSSYPYRLLDLLCEDPHEKTVNGLAFLGARKCCLDPFSQDLQARFATIDELQRPLFLTLLEIFCHLCECNTFSTERLHSKNSRRVHARAWTHELRLVQAASFHVGIAVPEFVKEALQREIRTSIRQTKSSTRKRRGRKPKKRASKRRKRGGGGRWRTFIHLQTVSGKADFRRCAELYRALSLEEKEGLDEIARLATKLHRQGHKAFPKTYEMSARPLLRELPAHGLSLEHERPAGPSFGVGLDRHDIPPGLNVPLKKPP